MAANNAKEAGKATYNAAGEKINAAGEKIRKFFKSIFTWC